MAEKPILFNTEMVRAILDGRKTQTRRLVKPKHKGATGFNVCFAGNGIGTFTGVFDIDEDGRMYEEHTPAPYQGNDILWVRETWAHVKFGTGDWHYEYRADCDNPQMFSNGSFAEWRPSIHMPREAARLFLQVGIVRIERLKDIRPKDAGAEGVIWETDNSGLFRRNEFRKLWDGTIKPADLSRYGWNANPWVWVIEFERLDGKPAGLWADQDTDQYADQDVLMPAT